LGLSGLGDGAGTISTDSDVSIFAAQSVSRSTICALLIGFETDGLRRDKEFGEHRRDGPSENRHWKSVGFL
jgi:hypothetical protein